MNYKTLKQYLKKIYFKYTGKIKKKRLNKYDFTIISNNCFGGIFYRDNNLEYLSPTCGLAFMAKEYIKFIYNMKYYLSIDNIQEISIEESKYSNYLKLIQYEGVIGKIEDLEILFLHYETIDEARQKWNRRKKRINYNKIVYKFNDQNLCEYDDLVDFEKFEAANKICFTSKQYEDINSVQLKKYKDNTFVLSDVNYRDYVKSFNVYNFINNLKEEKND